MKKKKINNYYDNIVVVYLHTCYILFDLWCVVSWGPLAIWHVILLKCYNSGFLMGTLL